MRSKFIFKVEENDSQIHTLPVYFRSIFLRFLKTALSQYNKEYFNSLYWWEDKKNKWQKPFVFSVNLPNMNFSENEVLFRGDIVLNLSTSDYEFFVNIYNSFINKNLYPFGLTDKCNIVLSKSYLVREPESFDSKMTFKTFSPILIEKKIENKKVPALPFEEDFEDIFNDVVDFEIRNIRLLRGDNRGLKKRITFKPVNVQKTVVKHRISDFEKFTGKEIMFLTGFSGIFELSGDPEDLKELYQNGIGFRRGQGFGFVEVVR